MRRRQVKPAFAARSMCPRQTLCLSHVTNSHRRTGADAAVRTLKHQPTSRNVSLADTERDRARKPQLEVPNINWCSSLHGPLSNTAPHTNQKAGIHHEASARSVRQHGGSREAYWQLRWAGARSGHCWPSWGEWLTRQVHHKASWSARLESVWRVPVVPKRGRRRIADIRPTEVQKWIAELELSASSIAHAHTVLVRILDDAVADHRLAANPARGTELPCKIPKARNYLTAMRASALANESKHPDIVCCSRRLGCGGEKRPHCGCVTSTSDVAASASSG